MFLYLVRVSWRMRAVCGARGAEGGVATSVRCCGNLRQERDQMRRLTTAPNCVCRVECGAWCGVWVPVPLVTHRHCVGCHWVTQSGDPSLLPVGSLLAGSRMHTTDSETKAHTSMVGVPCLVSRHTRHGHTRDIPAPKSGSARSRYMTTSWTPIVNDPISDT
jgi:hypothetical protein